MYLFVLQRIARKTELFFLFFVQAKIRKKTDIQHFIEMQRKIIIFAVFLTGLLVGHGVSAQNKEKMRTYEAELNRLFDKTFNAATDNERYNANELVIQLLEEALEINKSFKWQWNFGNNVSVLTSSDDRFKVFTWAVLRDNGEYECFGMMQILNTKTDEYDVYVLNDKSEEIFNPEESTLTAGNWYGVIYQDIVTIQCDNKTFYTLLGWTGGNTIIQRKVIEPLVLKNNSSQPTFGLNMFKHDKNLRRVVLQYSKKATVNLRYDEQYYQIEEKKKVKKNGKMVTVMVPREEKDYMIVYDDVQPVIEGMSGLYQYYVPIGIENAYYFNNGKWILRENIHGRLHEKEKYIKDFVPLKKKRPAYSTEVKPDGK